MTSFDILSLNASGLRNHVKRKSLFKKFKDSKFDIVCLQETYITEELVNQWKREWGGELAYSIGTARSKGLLTLINRKNDYDWQIIYSNDRILIIKIVINNAPLFVCNAYAPNNDNNIITFLNDLSALLSDLDPEKLVICGDFNSVLDNQLDIVSGDPHSEPKVTAFQNFTHVNDIFDSWRLFHDTQKDFTWSRVVRGKLIARRLDYIFTNDVVVDETLECNISSFPNTDHRGVILKLKTSMSPRGPGTWKMNNSLLKEQNYLDTINLLVDQFENDAQYRNLDPDIRWDLLKLKIKEETISYSKARASKKRNHLIRLQVDLDAIDKLLAKHPDEHRFVRQRQKILVELEILQNDKIRSSHIRAKEKWIEHGDKNSKFFLNLEKAKANSKIIPCLELENNITITDQSDIIKAQKEYYEKLYRIDNSILDATETEIDTFLNNAETPSLNEEEKNSCEGRVNLDELGRGLRELNNGSSPGLDGLSTEFYKVFWCKIAKLLVSSFNFSFDKGSLSYSQKLAVITLIHKGKELPKNKLSNWRPISLTNTDYKILAKTLALRVVGVIDKIVGKDQCAYVKGRQITDNLRTIDDVIEYLKYKNKPGVLLAIDFSKAFDSISRKFMINAFKKFGFGVQFTKWVQIIMSENRSSIGYNGWVSGTFKVERGIRQGCPFSPLAFIIGIEFLALRIRNDHRMKGIKIGNDLVDKIIKVILYADDVTLLLKDKEDLKLALDILDRFKDISGLSINRTKSEVMWLGSNVNLANEGLGLKWVNETKILGIFFSNRISTSQNEKNWKTRIENVKRIIKTWEKRNLSIIGKICIIKTFLASQFVYVMKTLILPDTVLTEINRIFFRFLWRKRDCNRKAYEKVKRVVMINNVELGGLRMVDMRFLQQSFQLEWIAKLYKSNSDDLKWTWVPLYYCKSLGFNLNMLNSTIGPKLFTNLENLSISFWKHNFNTWLFNNKTNTANDCIWYNDKIRYRNNVLFFKHWSINGIIFISDMVSDQGIISLQEVENKIGQYPGLLLEYNIVYNAISAFLRNQNLNQLNLEPKQLLFNDNMFLKASMFRDFLHELHYSKPSSERFWQNKFNLTLDKEHWSLAIQTTKESRLREFHFKILHNIYPTNILLCKMGISENNKCSHCPRDVDFIEHFFFECPKIRIIWEYVKNKIFQKYQIHLVLTRVEVLLGVYKKDNFSRESLKYLNHLILVAKMCIGIYRYGTPIDIGISFERECYIRKL